MMIVYDAIQHAQSTLTRKWVWPPDIISLAHARDCYSIVHARTFLAVQYLPGGNDCTVALRVSSVV